jgi:hypothetical protein
MSEADENGWRSDLRIKLEKAKALGFDGYCTDCESATFLHNGRCGCGSGRVVTSLPKPPSHPEEVGEPVDIGGKH